MKAVINRLQKIFEKVLFVLYWQAKPAPDIEGGEINTGYPDGETLQGSDVARSETNVYNETLLKTKVIEDKGGE